MQTNEPTYYEYAQPQGRGRHQWVVESNYWGGWSVRYGAENTHGRWTHFPSVPFDTRPEAVSFVERTIQRFNDNEVAA